VVETLYLGRPLRGNIFFYFLSPRSPADLRQKLFVAKGFAGWKVPLETAAKTLEMSTKA
jgi:hypothetical protein